MISQKTVCSFGALALVLLPTASFARVNTITTGISTSYDYNDRQTDPVPQDQTTIVANQQTTSDTNDYSRIAVTPLIEFVSDSQLDHLTFRAAPSIKYDLLGDQTDWDGDLFVSADRALSKAWQIRASNAFIRSDYHDLQSGDTNPQVSQNSPDATPVLSSDQGRTRYWRNTLNAGSKYSYDQDSLIDIGGDLTILRYDDSTTSTSQEDYDRYAFHVNNEHRYNAIWKSLAGLNVIRGNYSNPYTSSTTSTSAAANLSNTDLANDLWEYRLHAAVENKSFEHNKISLDYNYIGTQYDEAEKNNGQIHQSQLNWRHDFSQQLNSTLGAGPSYEKTEGQDGNWGENGIAEINYLTQHGSFTLGAEKRFDVDNFSGTTDRGFIDYWDTYFHFTYQLFEHLSCDGRLSYRNEDRTESALTTSSATIPVDPTLTQYNRDLTTAGIGLTYTFLQYYSAGLNYTFTSQDSEQIGDTYDDHRVLLTLSWKQEWLHW